MKPIAMGALAAMLAAATATAAEEKLIGTWAIQGGTTKDGLEIMVRIESIDERGRATGTYCSTRPNGTLFAFELRPKGAVRTSLKKGVLKFKRSKRKYELSMNEDGTMHYDFWSKGKKDSPRTMERSEVRGCLERFAAAGETATHTVADGAQEGFVGTWEGTAKNKIKIGIHVVSIGEDGQAEALYCWIRKDGSIVAFDAGAGATVKSVLEDGRLLAVRGKHSYALVASGEDKVRHTYRRNGKNPRHTTLKRTTPTGCLTRVRLREEPA